MAGPFTFGAESLAHLAKAHPLLRRVFGVVIRHWDSKIFDVDRTVDEQAKNVARGVSKTMKSMHLIHEDGFSHAVDSWPTPKQPNWRTIEKSIAALRQIDPTMELAEYYVYIGFQLGAGAALGIDLRAGIDWNRNNDLGDESFVDMPHVELRSTERHPPTEAAP